jgi:hypothetical protein
MTPVENTAKMQTIVPAILRFFSFGRFDFTVDLRESLNPLMARSECPKATTTATTDIHNRNVPCSHPHFHP